MKFYIGLLLLCLFGCGDKPLQDPKLQIISFSQEDLEVVNLTGQKIELEHSLLPKKILVKDGKLLVSEKSSGEQLKIYDLSTFSLLSKKGINGHGPGELTNIWKLVDKGEKGKVWAYDVEQKSFFRFDLTDDNPLADLEHRNIPGLFMAADMTWASDSTFWVTMVDGDVQYYELNLQADTLSSWGSWKSFEMKKDIPPNVTSSMHQGSLGANIIKRKGVVAGKLRPYVSIYDFDSGQGVSFRGPVDEYPEYGVEYSLGYPMPQIDPRKIKRYYLDAFAGDSYAFALYVGTLSGKLTESLNQVIVFDYQGNVVKSFQLDYPLASLTVDEKESKIYGVTRDEDPGIVVFDYSGWL